MQWWNVTNMRYLHIWFNAASYFTTASQKIKNTVYDLYTIYRWFKFTCKKSKQTKDFMNIWMFSISNLKSQNSLVKFLFVFDFTHIVLVYGVCENIQYGCKIMQNCNGANFTFNFSCPVKTIFLQIHWFRLFQCLWYTERFSVPSCVCKKSTKTPLGLAVKCIITKLKTSCYSELAAWQQRYDDLIEYDAYQHIKLPNSTWSCPSSARCLFVGCRMTLAIHSFTSKTLHRKTLS